MQGENILKNRFLMWWCVFLIVLTSFFSISCVKEPIKKTGLDKYLQVGVENSKLLIFPDLTNSKGIVEDCYSYTQDQLVDYSYEIFLKVKYEESDFQQEKERIKNLVYISEFLGIEKGVEVDEDCVLFNYPTYVATYWSDIHFEYVSFDFENSEIIYVYIEAVGFEDLTIPHKYLPKELTMGFENDYCHDMYAFCGEKWFGEEYHYE